MLTEEFDEALTTWFATQPPACLQHGHIRFACPIVFDALPSPDPQAILGSRLFQQHFYHRRLTNAWLTRDEDDLSLSAQRLLQPSVQLLQLSPPPHKIGG